MKNIRLFRAIIPLMAMIPLFMNGQSADFKFSHNAGQGRSNMPYMPSTMLYGQIANPSNEWTIASQDFPDYPTYSCQAADDFIVPAGQTWNIEQVYCSGSQSISGSVVQLSHLFIYSNDPAQNIPGLTVYAFMDSPVSADTSGNMTFSFASGAFVLSSGHYWISIQPHMNASLYGQWFWRKQLAPTILNKYHWRNPGGGFGIPGGQSWIPATSMPEPGNDYNLSFALYGTIPTPLVLSHTVIPDCPLYDIDLTVSGGILPYMIQWSTGATTEDISDLHPGTYTVTVTNGTLQIAVDTVVIPNICCPVFVLKDPVKLCPGFLDCCDTINGATSAAYEGMQTTTTQSPTTTNPECMAACKKTTHTYTIFPNLPGFTYTWTVTGGSPASATGNPLAILWGSGKEGRIKVVIRGTGDNACCVDSILVKICLHDGPEADFTADPDTACEDQLVYFTNTSKGGTLFSWDFGDGTILNSADGKSVSHSYATAGTYTVTLTATDMGDGEWKPVHYPNGAVGEERVPCGCVSTVSKQVLIIAGEGPDIIYKCCDDCKEGTICPDHTSTFCTSVICSSYMWSVHGGTIVSGSGTKCITVHWPLNYAGKTTVSLTTPGCTPCDQTTVLEVPVLYDKLPISGPVTRCADEAGTYQLPVMPGTYYTWSVTGTGNVINKADRNVAAVNIYFQFAGTDTVWCRYHNPMAGCSGSSFLLVTRVPRFTFTAGQEIVCLASSYTSSYTVNGAADWVVTPSGAMISTPLNSPSTSITWPGPGTYIITATPVSPASYCTPSASMMVEVVAPPVLGSIGGPAQICPGKSYMFTISSDTKGSPFHWLLNNSTTNVIMENGPDHDTAFMWLSGPGPWTISVNQSKEISPGVYCPSLYQSKPVSVCPPPLISLAGIANPVCVDDIATYSATGGCPSEAYQWTISPSKLGTILSGQGTPSVQIRWHGIAGVPASAQLKVTTCNGSNQTSITINEPPAAQITANMTTVFCYGDVQTLILTASPSGCTYEWYKEGVSGFFSTASSININISSLPVGTHRYYAMITQNGCTEKSNTIEVIISNCPSCIPGTGPQCVAYFVAIIGCYGQVTLVDQSASAPPSTYSGTYHIVQTAGGSLSITLPLIPVVNITLPPPGTYQITLTINSSTGCTDTYTLILTIPSITAGITHSSPVCLNKPIAFSASPNNPDYRYKWSFNDLNSISLEPVTDKAFSTPGNHTIDLKITDTKGCDYFASDTVVVNPLPVCIPNAPDTTFCPGDSALITGCAGISYQWYRNNAPIPGETNVTCYAKISGEYWVEVTNAYNCTDTSRHIFMYQLPAPQVKIKGKKSICAKAGVNTLTLSTYYNWHYLYSWRAEPAADVSFNQNNTASTAISITLNSAITDPLIYWFFVTVTDNTTGCSASDSVCIWLYPSPDLSIIGSLYICEGMPAGVMANPNDPSLYDYKWSNGETTPVIYPKSPGWYSLVITDKLYGCRDEEDAGMVFPKPDLSLFPLGCDTICDTATFYDYIPLALLRYTTYASEYLSIDWFDQGVYIGSGENLAFNNTHPQFNPAPGDHRISTIVMNKYTCIDTSDVFCLHVKKCKPCCFAKTDPLFRKILADTVISSDMVWDGKWYISEDVMVTVDHAVLDVTNVDVVFDPCAGITFINGAHLRANNSVFRPCYIDSTWIGLRFIGSNPVYDNIINECTFKNAHVALFFEASDGVVSNNLFSNCNYGIRVTGNTNFNHPISGNRIVTDPFFPIFNSCDPLGYPFINSSSTYGIYANASRFTGQISQNDFLNSIGNYPRVFGIYEVSGGGAITGNRFTDVFSPIFLQAQAFYTSIENNDIEMNIFGSSAPAIHVASGKGPLTEINNNRIWSNFGQATGYQGINASSNSHLSILNNRIDGFNYGIVLSNNGNSQISKNEIRECLFYGINNLEMAGSRSYITCNTIRMRNYSKSTGLAGGSMSSSSEVTENCILDSRMSMFFRGAAFARYLPYIRNNFSYNYNNFGISVSNLSGNIGTNSDPGLNTLWSNLTSAVDINSDSKISVADNFGMFNISWQTVQITSNRPYHSTASCAQQIFNMPSQGQLNVKYTCDHLPMVTQPLTGTKGIFSLPSGFPDLLKASSNRFADARMIMANYEPANIALLEELAGLAGLTDNQKWLLYYDYHYRNNQFAEAESYLNKFVPADENEKDYKVLRAYDLQVLQHGYSSLTGQDRAILADFAQKEPVVANFAIGILNNSPFYRDYIFEELPPEDAVIFGEVRRVDGSEGFLKIYPNPFTDKVFVELINTGNLPGKIEVLNMIGEHVAGFTVDFVAGGLTLDLHQLHAGIYFLVLTDADSGTIQKGKMIKINK